MAVVVAFERLQRLGEEKFTKILNLLMRGEPAMRLAREIQQPPPEGWGEFQDVPEKTLTQQLNRLRAAAAEGAFGKRAARAITEGNTPPLRMLEKVSVRVLDRMEELSELQRARVLALVEREKSSLMPIIQGKMGPQEYRYLLAQTNMVFNDYRQVLLDLQEIRFKLGLDEYKGPVTHGVKGSATSVSLPDGTNIQKQVFEAVNMVEDIFNARKIPARE